MGRSPGSEPVAPAVFELGRVCSLDGEKGGDVGGGHKSSRELFALGAADCITICILVSCWPHRCT